MNPRRTRRILSAVVAAGVVATASGFAAAPYPEAPPDSPETPPIPTPVVDEAALVDTFETLAADMLIPGAVMLLRTPEGEFTATYGVRELGGDVPVTLDDHIRVGSNTKTMTGTVILQLVEEGSLALEDPVSKYRPDVPNGDAITIAQLLNMRSGLFNYSETYELNAGLDADPARHWDPEELAAMGLALPPYFEPDQGWHYSNTNTVLLGLIAEQLDGKPLDQIFQERIFDPSGLDETSFPASGGELPEPYSNGYMYMDNTLTISSTVLPADLQAAAEAGTLLPNDQTHADPSWAWAAGGAISTAGDLADWVEILVEGGALDEQMQEERLASIQPTSDEPDAASYGYAIAEMGPFLGHTGELPGYNSFMGRQPDTDVTLVVWTNLAPTAAGEDPATEIAKAVIGMLYPAPAPAPAS